MSGTVTLALSALSLLFTVVALILTLFVLGARSIFVACVLCMVISIVTALALASSGATLAAVAIGCFGVGLLPVLLLGGALLSTASAKSQQRGRPWLTGIAALITPCAVLSVSPELAAGTAPQRFAPEGFAMLIAALLFAAGLVSIALIGFGERGALERGGGGS